MLLLRFVMELVNLRFVVSRLSEIAQGFSLRPFFSAPEDVLGFLFFGRDISLCESIRALLNEVLTQC